MKFEKQKYNKIIIYLIFIIIAFITRYYLFGDRNSWHDEWHSIYVANPNLSNEETFLRYYGDKGDSFLTEYYPPLYLFILKNFFKLFGYVDDYGRSLSLIFGILTVPLAMILTSMFERKKSYIITGILVSFNLFLIWQSLEIRAHSIFVAISLLNIILFYKILDSKKFILLSLYFITSLFLLSIWPITGAIFFGKSIYLIKQFVIKKEKNIIIFVLFALIVIFYILINIDYLVFNIGRPDHYTKLNLSFFYSYHFRTFFGSLYLGAIFLIIFAFLFLKNIKSLIFQNKKEDLLMLIILSSYFLTLLYTSLRASIMSPKYVMYILPLIIIWISLKIPYENNKILNIFLISISLIFFKLNILNSPIDRPPTKELLRMAKNENIRFIITKEPDVFDNYLRTKKIVVDNKIKIIQSANELPNNINSFWFLCLNNPRFAVGDKGLIKNNPSPDKKCLEFELDNRFKEISSKIIIIQDYYIIKFKRY